MSTSTRRYIFVDFENLLKVKVKKLDKVCDRVFIFINSEEQSIPFSLVQQIQRLGKGVKWIPVVDPIDNNMNYHLCFVLGRLHQKLSNDIEFAILSNDPEFDPLVRFINGDGRPCMRVKRKRTKQEKTLASYQVIEDENFGRRQIDIGEYADPNYSPESIISKRLIEERTDYTKQRLMRLATRPTEVDQLRDYILLHNQELTKHGSANMIIRRMEETEAIEIKGNAQVVYNF